MARARERGKRNRSECERKTGWKKAENIIKSLYNLLYLRFNASSSIYVCMCGHILEGMSRCVCACYSHMFELHAVQGARSKEEECSFEAHNCLQFMRISYGGNILFSILLLNANETTQKKKMHRPLFQGTTSSTNVLTRKSRQIELEFQMKTQVQK